MNKDIIYSNENSVLFFDEFGNITEKSNENNIEDKLGIENKLENIKKISNQLEEQIQECNNINNTCEVTLKMMAPLAALLVPLVFISVPVSIFVGSSGIVISVGTMIIKKSNDKNKKGIKAKLEIVNNFEKQCQDELDEKKTFDSQPEVSKENVITNELISVKYNDDLDKSENETIDMIYDKVYSCDDKPKSLIKKKK